jgi:hypothetical protein
LERLSIILLGIGRIVVQAFAILAFAKFPDDLLPLSEATKSMNLAAKG